MGNVADKLIGFFFAAVIVSIVFVSAGKTGESGGKQTADVIYAGGSTLANTAKGLEQG